jgi:hypothetical protein
LIEEYLHSLLDVVAASPSVRIPDITFEKRSSYVAFFRGSISFKDDSLLHFRELMNLRLNDRPIAYAYHYQRADHSLVFRYDNADHFPSLPNAPHHKHAGAESNVVSATAPDLATVLEEIESLIAVTSSMTGA